ncbi:MAG: histidine kinase N-terminal domain-containing protein [Actinobacteria bacterium]|nr:histidine kinase N-terminal domain-containing protein [Actinomycetota bacterium]
MTSLADLTREHSVLDREDVDHLHRLGAEWAFLADLCFADLLLHVRTGDGRWLIVDQVRPATNQTMYVTDYVGSYAESDDADIIERAATTGVRVEGEIELTDDPDATTARMSATQLLDDLRRVRANDRGGNVPIRGSSCRLQRGATDRRRCLDPRWSGKGHVRITKRELCTSPRRDSGQPDRNASR